MAVPSSPSACDLNNHVEGKLHRITKLSEKVRFSQWGTVCKFSIRYAGK